MHKEFRLVNAKKIILWALVRKHQWDENQTVNNDNSSDLNIRNLRLFFAAYLPFFPPSRTWGKDLSLSSQGGFRNLEQHNLK